MKRLILTLAALALFTGCAEPTRYYWLRYDKSVEAYRLWTGKSYDSPEQIEFAIKVNVERIGVVQTFYIGENCESLGAEEYVRCENESELDEARAIHEAEDSARAEAFAESFRNATPPDSAGGGQ